MVVHGRRGGSRQDSVVLLGRRRHRRLPGRSIITCIAKAAVIIFCANLHSNFPSYNASADQDKGVR